MTRKKSTVFNWQAAGYGVGDLGMNLYWNSLSLLILFWYTDIIGLEPAVAGFIFFVGTIWDAFNDPVMASIAERTQTRWGSYRPYILFGGVALAASFLLLFWMPPFEGTLLLLTLIAIHLLFRTCYTVVAIPYSALSSRLTDDSRTRTVLSGYRMFFAFLGFFIVSSTAFPIVRRFGDGTESSQAGFTAFAALCGVLALVCYWVCFRTTKEAARSSSEDFQSIRDTLRDMRIIMVRNRALHTMLAIIAFQSAANIVFLSTLTFFIETNSAVLRQKEEVLGLNAFFMFASVPLWTLAAHRLGKRRTWLIASAFVIGSGFHLAGFGMILIDGFVLQILIIGTGFSAFGILVWSMIPDTIEYGAWQTGVRSEAAAFGLSLFVQKASIGVAGLAVGLLLQTSGYTGQDEARSPDVIDDIQMLVSLGPAVLLFCSAIFVFLHPISHATHLRAVEALRARNNREL